VVEVDHINNLDFAMRQQVLDGEIPLANMTRLHTILADGGDLASDSHIRFKLTGQSQHYHLPSLHLILEANLPMLCQRCLAQMSVPIQLHFEYVVSAEESAALDESDEMDWVEQSDAMDLQALIEDELLIALPIAPVHSPLCKQLNLESGEKPNPFSVLKALKKDGNP
jgi:uncharacterized protein